MRRAFAAAAVTLLIACGGDATEPADGLTAADVRSMIEALDEVDAFSFNFGAGARGATIDRGLGLQFYTRVDTISQNISCAGGGTANLAGRLETVSAGADASYDITLVERHSSCAGTMHNGRQFTFDGDPSGTLVLYYSLNSTTKVMKMHGTFVGTFQWRNVDGRSGTCSADLALSSTHPASTDTHRIETGSAGQITGHICSRAFDVHY
ncbi:MAG TPA: hypothetical protein VE967_12930 [Gemmatimonadaceae bacterium]|nr:hypothetical protein [Gemmatimonadaceae bacterium]